MARLGKTLADYVAIALSPALIMLMVGSLMWFLVAVFYEGRYEGRIYWILACFVLAIVLIARIAIEESQERAMLFALPLAGAVGLAAMRFSDSVFLHWVLLAVAWWSSDRLTRDCTFIDEEQDSSGQGLLQLIGFGKQDASSDAGQEENGAAADSRPADDPDEPEGVTERVGRMRDEAHPKRKTKGKAHAPGVWIVYFSLAALPLFGLGQLLIPLSDTGRRLWAFQLLAVYVAAGLGLLVTTSFLGLRRYLRQRGVQMPPQMAAAWIALGAVLIVVLLVVCALLPRPAAEYPLAQMPDMPLKFSTPERESNRHAPGSDGADENADDSQSLTQGEQDGTKPEGGKPDESSEGGGSQGESSQQQGGQQQGGQQGQGSQSGQQQGGEQSQGGEQGESSQDQGQGSQSGEQSGQQQGSEQSQGGEQGESSQDEGQNSQSGERSSQQQREPSQGGQSGGRQQGEQSQQEQDRQGGSGEQRSSDQQAESEAADESPAQEPSEPWFQMPEISLSGGLFGLLKFLIYVAIACAAAYWAWRNRARLLAGLRQLIQELREFWAKLFGRTPAPPETDEEQQPKKRALRPFADYVDPFAGGIADRYTPDELVRYTFEATEAWARENGCTREPEHTPHEFAARVGGHVGSLKSGAMALANLYCQVAYAPGSLAAESLDPLADFWRRLKMAHRTAQAAEA